MPIRAMRRPLCLVLATLTLAAGLGWRLMPLGLPPAPVKYGGSALWAMMIYWLVAFAWPRWTPSRLGLVAGLITAAVEFFRLYHAPGLDAFRLTLAGRLLLGRFFSLIDIAVYWIAIAFVAVVDSNASHDGRA